MKVAFCRRAWACVFFLAVIALLAVSVPTRAQPLDMSRAPP
jgi:hypothetical protein